MLSASPVRLSFGWWIVMLGLSASLSLNYVLPVLNAQAGAFSAFSPFHPHVLYGGSAADRAWLLAHHTHDPAAPDAPATNATLISAGTGAADLHSLTAGQPLLGAFDWPHPLVPPALWLLLLPALVILLGLTAPPPDRPPRPA